MKVLLLVNLMECESFSRKLKKFCRCCDNQIYKEETKSEQTHKTETESEDNSSRKDVIIRRLKGKKSDKEQDNVIINYRKCHEIKLNDIDVDDSGDR